jgi:hypothetical protein
VAPVAEADCEGLASSVAEEQALNTRDKEARAATTPVDFLMNMVLILH